MSLDPAVSSKPFSHMTMCPDDGPEHPGWAVFFHPLASSQPPTEGQKRPIRSCGIDGDTEALLQDGTKGFVIAGDLTKVSSRDDPIFFRYSEDSTFEMLTGKAPDFLSLVAAQVTVALKIPVLCFTIQKDGADSAHLISVRGIQQTRKELRNRLDRAGLKRRIFRLGPGGEPTHVIVLDPSRRLEEAIERFVEEYQIQSRIVCGTMEIAFTRKASFVLV